MNKKQKENLAKFFYDCGRIIFGTLVVGNLAFRQFFDPLTFWSGIIGTVLAISLALDLEKTKRRRRKK